MTRSWLLTIDYRSRTPQDQIDIADDRLGVCAELLSEHLGEAATDGHYYSVSVMVETTSPGTALQIGGDLIGAAVQQAGLPSWGIVRTEMIREDEVRRSRVE
ncbi:MAG TPA: hypothetical protein VHB02_05935 [Acidimicrobiales bacterium]|nr:hypothetical protein [Acidimicrobiales bacterium]